MGDFEFDTREFVKCFDEVLASGKRTAAQIINRAGLLTVVGGKGVKGAMQLTPRASKAAINGLDKKLVTGFIITKAKKKGEWPLSRAEIKSRTDKEIKRRIRAIGYTAGPGWSNAAQAFGGRGVGRQGGFSQSKASKGSGSMATPENLVAEMINTAPNADAIGREALQKALDNAAKDMLEFHRKKMAEALAKNSVK